MDSEGSLYTVLVQKNAEIRKGQFECSLVKFKINRALQRYYKNTLHKCNAIYYTEKSLNIAECSDSQIPSQAFRTSTN